VRYLLLGPDETALDSGEGRAEVRDGTLVVTPTLGQPLRIRPADIAEVRDLGPGALGLRLTDGSALTLEQLGRLHGQLLADLGEARGDDLTSTLLLVGVGNPEAFHGTLDGTAAQLRLYDDALVALPDVGDPEQVLYAFVGDVVVDDSGYRIAVRTLDERTLAIGGLARRTSEFLDLLRARVTTARGRTGYLVSALLPALGPLPARRLATALVDGVAAPRAQLDAAESGAFAALVAACTMPDRLRGVPVLAELGDLALGLHQRTTVEHAPAGGSAERAPDSVARTDHGGIPAAPGGLAGVLHGGLIEHLGQSGLGGPGGPGGPGIPDLATAVAYRLVGGTIAGGALGHDHQATARSQPHAVTGSLPAWSRLSELRVDGGAPSVLAFMFCRTVSGLLVYEVLNETDHATYVFGPGADLPAVNRALATIGFRVEAITDDAADPASRYRRAVQRLPQLRVLRETYRGRVLHGEGWESRLRDLLGA
jgi:hypothetical protein